MHANFITISLTMTCSLQSKAFWGHVSFYLTSSRTGQPLIYSNIVEYLAMINIKVLNTLSTKLLATRPLKQEYSLILIFWLKGAVGSGCMWFSTSNIPLFSHLQQIDMTVGNHSHLLLRVFMYYHHRRTRSAPSQMFSALVKLQHSQSVKLLQDFKIKHPKLFNFH